MLLPKSCTDLELDTLIELFEVSHFNLENLQEKIYFCNMTGVIFNDIEYTPIAFESNGFDVTSQSANPRPKVVVSNIGRFIGDWIRRCKGASAYRLEGCRFTRRLTQKRYLDGEEGSAEAIREYPKHVYRLEQIPNRNREVVEFMLANPFELEDATLPGRIASKHCPWIFRSADCGYSGSVMRDIDGNLTIDPAKFDCGRTARNCAQYFGDNVVLPFGGFVNLNKIG